jgi:pimeloyl-ACP methyl ester carboxylesterase
VRDRTGATRRVPYSSVMETPYAVARAPTHRNLLLRGLRYHTLHWGEPGLVTAARPLLVMAHGWMDVAASFQFVVDALAAIEGPIRHVVALDWRGFGLTESTPADCYWFPDYLGDLDALLEALSPGAPVDLLGHSMGGNVVMTYAGVRPERIRKLINLEGFGMPRTEASTAPQRYAKWLAELREVPEFRTYASLDEVAQRLRKTNPYLSEQRAAWLAPHWSRQRDDARWEILGDPLHKRVNPVQHRVEETLEIWKRISAPLLWVEGDRSELHKWWSGRYSREEFEARLGVVPEVQKHQLNNAGHMLHHDQPEALARRLAQFLGG